MASPGDLIKCRCGTKLKLVNDRVPWHRIPDAKHGRGLRGTCGWSGKPAENWDAVGKTIVVQGITMTCPACGERNEVKHVAGKYPLLCGTCGNTGSADEFAMPEINRVTSRSKLSEEEAYKAQLEEMRKKYIVRRR